MTFTQTGGPEKSSRRQLVACLAVVGVVLGGLVGCGGEAKAIKTGEARQDADLKFAKCMRDNGVDYPDPVESGGVVHIERSLPNTRDTTTALAKCKKLAPDADAPPEPVSPEVVAKQLALTQCLRANGIDATDPVTDSLGDSNFSVPSTDVTDESGRPICRAEYAAAGFPAPGE